MPAEAPRAACDAVCSMLDKPVLRLLMEAFPLSTFTSTTSSSLLSLAIVISGQLLAVQLVSLLGDNQHGVELVRGDLIKTNGYRQFEGAQEIERTPDQQARLGMLGSVEPVERAMVAAAAIVGRIRAEARLTELLAPQ